MKMTAEDWERLPNFSAAEFNCKHTGRNEMNLEFMAALQDLRAVYAKPMVITSGYRDPSHPVEARKAQPGTHAQGIAADIAVSGADAHRLVSIALLMGFTGVGISQRGGRARFVHLDLSTERNAIWSY